MTGVLFPEAMTDPLEYCIIPFSWQTEELVESSILSKTSPANLGYLGYKKETIMLMDMFYI